MTEQVAVVSEKFAVYGANRIPIPRGVTGAEVREVMARQFPELGNGTMVERENGDLEFLAVAGEKG